MKLTIEHLAAYLPYDLLFKTSPLELKKIPYKKLEHYKLKGIRHSNPMPICIFVYENMPELCLYFNIDVVNPILRPLSDLTKEIEHNGEKFIPINYNAFKNSKKDLIEYQNGFLHYKAIKYEIIKRFLEWHFDVFGLIENNLAIDINMI